MPPKKKAANGYKFAEPLPKGIVLEDVGKKKWRLGPSIGKGGFGEIYSAQEESSKGDKYPYVIKIEPHANGPLFVEINFYIRNAKPANIEDFKKEKGLKIFGMPVYQGSGSVEYKEEKYRFLVMDKFSTDVYKLYVDNKKVFPVDTVFKLGLQVLDVLEYIHQRGYVHADIKAANMLLGATKETQNKQVYLVDFGLASKYTMESEFKPNPKKAHDGTIEFLSRDAHQGVQTRRGDLEILAYNLIQWLGCKLPWEHNLSDPKVVQNSKNENMATVPKMIKASFPSKTPPKAIVDFLTYLRTLKFNTEPDYKKIRTIFTSGVKASGGSIGTIFQFCESKTPSKRNHTPIKNSQSKKTKSNKGEENGAVNSDGDETPIPNKRPRAKNDLIVTNEESDVEMDIENDDEKTPVPRRRGQFKKYIESKKQKKQSKVNVSENEVSDVDMDSVSSNEDSDYNAPIKTRGRRQKKGETNYSKSKRRSGRAQKLKEIQVNNDENSDNFELPRERTKKAKQECSESGAIQSNRQIEESVSDTELVTADNSNEEPNISFVTRRKKPQTASKGLGRKKSKSLDDLSNGVNLEGFTDAMKEVMLKKMKNGGRKKRVNTTQKTQLSTHQDEDDMIGFTEEMKAIALKKKSKEKRGKKTTAIVPIATTSKASNKRGLVKPDSKRLQKTSPVTHGEVARFSDGSVSE